MTAVVGWKISSSYWLDESKCVMLVGWLIWDFVSICKRNGFFVREDEVSVMCGHGVLLTHCGRVMQICVFTLQLCKTDDANLRF